MIGYKTGLIALDGQIYSTFGELTFKKGLRLRSNIATVFHKDPESIIDLIGKREIKIHRGKTIETFSILMKAEVHPHDQTDSQIISAEYTITDLFPNKELILDDDFSSVQKYL